MRGVLLGVAAGTVSGLGAVALKATVHAASHGVLAVLASGWLYLVIALGAWVLLLSQHAYRRAPLPARADQRAKE